MRARFLALPLLASVALLLVGVSGAAALSPVPPSEAAELVFDNGGRIVSIKADGSDRTVLTRKNGRVVAERSWDAVIPVQDSNPSISPDGTKLLFERRFDLGPVTWRTEIIVANRDGTGQKVIANWKSPVVTWLGWGPDNRAVVGRYAYRMSGKHESQKYWVVSFDQSGGDRRLLISREFKASDFKNHDRFFSSSIQLADFSPDGESMIYTVSDSKRSDLMERDLDSGEERLVLKGVDEASYSPDSSAIAFTPASCQGSKRLLACEGREFGLWTARLDGSGERRLLGKLGGPAGLDWSPDGKTIVFSSSRNFPGGGGEASEIYSIGADGKCLTWLTNGSPESVNPSWGPEAAPSSPGACGAAGRKPLVEVTPNQVKNPPSPRLWAGPSIRGRLLSSTSASRRSEAFYYEDCAFYDRKKCREGMVVESIPTCNPRNLASTVELHFNRFVASVGRGGLLYSTWSRKGDVASLLWTGEAEIHFGDSWAVRTGGIPNTGRDQKLVLNLLRPIGKPADPKLKLPAPALRREDIRGINRIYRVYDRTGSIAKTAREVGTSRLDVRMSVRYRGLMKRLMPFKVAKCGR